MLDGGGNLLVLVDDGADRGKDVLQGLLHCIGVSCGGIRLTMAGVHAVDGRVHAFAQADDHLFDFRRGLLGALRQAAHLVGDHREATPLLTGAGRLDGALSASRLVCSATPLITSST